MDLEAGIPTEAIRRAFDALPSDVAKYTTEPPRLSDIYVVPGHEKALNPEMPLVVGDRGTGKSFWSAALIGAESRELIDKQFRRLNLASLHVTTGFSAERSPRQHPSRQTLESLRADGHKPEAIWRTVVLFQLAASVGRELQGSNWTERVNFVNDNPEIEERLLREVDSDLSSSARQHLIVFDALDRLGSSWLIIRELVQGLLRVALDLRGYKAIKTKLFIRPDMAQDRAIWSFQDASKLQHSRVLLEWRRVDLYGLLWHWLANRPRSQHNDHDDFRAWCEGLYTERFEEIVVGSESPVYVVPLALRSDEARQEDLLLRLASKYMGRNRRRGKTYTWLPTHLADANGNVSPRSFLIALRRAQESSRDRGSGEVLHYEGIKDGVRQASDVRLAELLEDYPWVDAVLTPLRGLTVPASPGEFKARWKNASVVNQISNVDVDYHKTHDERPSLPPHALEAVSSGEKEDGLVDALVEIGVLSRMADQRLNMPDLFRVAAGIGRKGGVRAIH